MKRWKIATALLVAALALVVWWLAPGGGPDLGALPEPSLQGLEAPVAAALDAARRAVVAAPRSATAWGRFGMVLDAHELIAEAAVAYANAAVLDPKDFRWPYMEALCLPEGEPETLLRLLERSRSLRPDYAPVHLRLGFQHLLAGDLDSAETDFAAALARSPGHSHALYGRARIRVSRGDPVAARPLLEEAARNRPDHREVQASLAAVYARLGLASFASKARRRAEGLTGATPIPDPARSEVASLGQGSTHLMSRARTAVQAGNVLAVEAIFAEVQRLRPDDVTVPAERARALLGLGKLSEAVIVLEAIITSDRRPLPAKRMLALAQEKLGSPIRAQAAARAVLIEAPADVGMRLLLARLRLGEARPAETVAILRQILEDEPGEEEAAALLVWIAATHRVAPPDARELLRIAEVLCDDYLEPAPRSLLALGAALTLQGRFEDALAALDRARGHAQAAGDQAFLDETAPVREAWRAGTPWLLPR